MAEFFLTPENFSQSLFHCDKQFLRVNSHRILKDVLEFNEGELGVFCATNQIFLLQHIDITKPSSRRVVSLFNHENQLTTDVKLDFEMKKDVKINYSVCMLDDSSCAVIGGTSLLSATEIPENYILTVLESSDIEHKVIA